MARLTDYVTFKDQKLGQTYAKKPIPMATLYEAYFDGALDIPGDLYAMLRARHDFVSWSLTKEHLRWAVTNFIPEVVIHMNKYVFPGADASLCPSAMLKSMEKAGWETHSVENISIHYGFTIKRWHDNWIANREAVTAAYGDRWYRIWHFFLAWSVIIAEQGNAACFQVVLNKNLDAFDRTRWVDKRSVILGDRAAFAPSQAAAE